MLTQLRAIPSNFPTRYVFIVLSILWNTRVGYTITPVSRLDNTNETSNIYWFHISQKFELGIKSAH